MTGTGVGRGLLGVVGLPLSGALGLVGAMTTGLASSTGLTTGPSVRRRGRLEGVIHLVMFSLLCTAASLPSP